MYFPAIKNKKRGEWAGGPWSPHNSVAPSSIILQNLFQICKYMIFVLIVVIITSVITSTPHSGSKFQLYFQATAVKVIIFVIKTRQNSRRLVVK